jgi:hypothetical protein
MVRNHWTALPSKHANSTGPITRCLDYFIAKFLEIENQTGTLTRLALAKNDKENGLLTRGLQSTGMVVTQGQTKNATVLTRALPFPIYAASICFPAPVVDDTFHGGEDVVSPFFERLV